MAAATAVVAAAAIMGVAIAAEVPGIISAAGIMAAAIFTAGRRIPAHSPDIVRSPHTGRSRRSA
jgi:hypothetical protein